MVAKNGEKMDGYKMKLLFSLPGNNAKAIRCFYYHLYAHPIFLNKLYFIFAEMKS